MATYKPTIGIEVHAELNTKSKMFCGCKNDPHHSDPNTNICPVCLAHPGTLPQVNKEAIKKVLSFGEAINAELADFSEFDRKQYFYPDIPKAYQLSQYAFPFVKGGEVAGIAITRVHLEEDTAKSSHVNANSEVDFNRAGVPLMELVTEPVIHDAETAVKFAKELQLLLRTLGISNANMEMGEMRVEANISISANDSLGTKVEVKNLNSFKAMEQAIKFEISRQSEMLDKNEAIKQETLGWDENKSRTFSQRSKEKAEDYRYFPDPDIPKFKISEVESFVKGSLLEGKRDLPENIRKKYANLGLPENQIETLLYNFELRDFFDSVTTHLTGEDSPKSILLAANYICSDLAGQMVSNSGFDLNKADSSMFSKLVSMLSRGDINSRVAKDLLPEVVFNGLDPEMLAKDRGLLQSSSSEELGGVVETVIADNPKVVEDYRAGKETSIQYLVGQAMKATKGAANPAVLLTLFKDRLSK